MIGMNVVRNVVVVGSVAAVALAFAGFVGARSADVQLDTDAMVGDASAAEQTGGVGVTVSSAAEAVRTREVTYVVDGRTYRGMLAAPVGASAESPRPGVLVVHEWWGRNEYADGRARQLAALGYVAFVVDMYGDGRVVASPERARNLATPFYTDRGMMVERASAGLEQLRTLAEVDGERLAAIGYCFGGSVALELARSGAALDAVVSFHGGLSSPNRMGEEPFDGHVFVANGAADELVSVDERNAFVREMESSGVDYVFTEYGGAVHSFTNPDADALGMNSVGYDAAADRRSWLHMLLVLDEALAG